MINKTISYYDTNADKLLADYDKADMSKAYAFIEKYLKSTDKVLDIGFGSGRDMRYFINKNIDIYGIDGSKEFLSIFRSKYPNLSDYVFYSELPNIKIPKKFSKNYFDLIFSMATWMHIPKKNHKETILNIKSILKANGILILAYSCNSRKNDLRFFEDLTPGYVKELFESNDFKMIDSIESSDGLQRNEIVWITQVFKLK